ncbi:MAG TPA: hypothetical protein VM434_17320 [Beijerinckiaceae bacterium]|nr:hypothetical protein [Beijerinckiaceae bacterium]
MKNDDACEPRIDPVAQARIGRLLRVLYRNVEGEPLPMEQIDLLLTLRHKERELRRRAAQRDAR